MSLDMSDRKSPYEYRDCLSRQNEILAEENRRLRQCLQLTKENCELHTLNYLTYALSMNDVKLRKFYTDIVLPLTKTSTSKPPLPSHSTDIYHSRQQQSTGDTSYGKSFQEIHLDDIRGSYYDQYSGQSNSYGKSFKEIDLNELQDSYENKSYGQQHNGARVNKSHRQHSPSDLLTNVSQGQRPNYMRSSMPNTPVTGRSGMESHAPKFYDSLESNQSDSKYHHPYQHPQDLNPMQRNNYADQRDSHQSQPFQEVNNISFQRPNIRKLSHATNGSQVPYTGHSLHASDLGYTNRPSAFRPYKRGHSESGQNQEDYAYHQNNSDNNDTNPQNIPPLPSNDVYSNAPRNPFYENQTPASNFAVTGHLYSNPSRSHPSNNSNSPFGQREIPNERGHQTSVRSNFIAGPSPHPVANHEHVQAPFSNSAAVNHTSYDQSSTGKDGAQHMMVRVNTIVGHMDENGTIEKSNFVEEYAVPYKPPKSPVLKERLSDQRGKSQTTNNSMINDSLEQFDEGTGQRIRGTPMLPHAPTSQNFESYQHRADMTNGVTSAQRPFTPTKDSMSKQQHGIVRYMPNGSDSGLPTDSGNSVFLHDSNVYGNHQGAYPPITQQQTERPKSVTFDIDNHENGQLSQMSRGHIQGQYKEVNTISRSSYGNNDTGTNQFLLGEPIATSTPKRSPRNRNKIYREEQQSNADQLSQYISDFSDYETARTSTQPSPSPRPKARSPRQQSSLKSNTFDQQYARNSDSSENERMGNTSGPLPVLNGLQTGGTRNRAASAPPPRYGNNHGTGSSILKPTAVSAPGRKMKQTSKKSRNQQTIVYLADILGIRGNNALEKVEFYIHRPVDVLTGFQPEVTSETCRVLMEVRPSQRVVGEIAFQLDRRILEFVVRGDQDEPPPKHSFRYYGYSLTNIYQLIAKEATEGDVINPQIDFMLRKRFEFIKNKLKQFDYKFEFHAQFAQDMVNKYGLLNISSNDKATDKYGLSDTILTRLRLCQVLATDTEKENMLIIYDCLCFLSFDDGRDLFLS